MKTEDCQLCEAILSHGEVTGRLSLAKVTRNGALLLALPLDRRIALTTLRLYQPQRWKGRFLRKLVQMCVTLGLHRFLPRYEIEIGDQGLFSGLDHEIQANGFGFLLGSVDSPLRNLIGVYEMNKALRVVKAGCGKAAEVVRSESDSIKDFGQLVDGVPECYGVFSHGDVVAYVAEFIHGRSPRGLTDDELVFDLLSKWLERGVSMAVSQLDCWKALDVKLNGETLMKFKALSQLALTSPVMHGDFAPWNIKIDDGGSVSVLDWECAEQFGMPGWDWLHYQVQWMRLVEDVSAEEIIVKCREMLSREPMLTYMGNAGVDEQEDLLLGAYLYYSGVVHGYPREDLIQVWESTYIS